MCTFYVCVCVCGLVLYVCMCACARVCARGSLCALIVLKETIIRQWKEGESVGGKTH